MPLSSPTQLFFRKHPTMYFRTRLLLLLYRTFFFSPGTSRRVRGGVLHRRPLDGTAGQQNGPSDPKEARTLWPSLRVSAVTGVLTSEGMGRHRLRRTKVWLHPLAEKPPASPSLSIRKTRIWIPCIGSSPTF